MTRVAICYLSGDLLHADFAGCLVDAIATAMQSKHRIVRHNVKCTIIAEGRNDGVRSAQLQGCSHLLFLDSDMIFPANIVDRLLAHDKTIVGATYMSRRPRPDIGQHVLLHRELDGKPSHLGTGIRRVEALPTGCLMVKTEVFSVLPAPWFYFGLQPDGHMVGEDYAFCRAVRERGLDIWLDPDVSADIGHIASTPLYPGMFGHGASV